MKILWGFILGFLSASAELLALLFYLFITGVVK